MKNSAKFNPYIILGVILLICIVFSVIQIIRASPGHPNPGHPWSEIGNVETGDDALPVIRGGTGLSSLTQGYIPFGKGTSAFGSSVNLFWDETNSRLGIGTTTPGARLEVAGQIKITGGSPGLGKVLISDATGLASWSPEVRDISYYRRVGTAVPEVWYTSPVTGTALTTGAPTANVLRAIPFISSRTVTLDRIAINVTTAAAGSFARMGIYRDGGNLYPSTLVPGTDVAEVDTGTTGVKANTISVTLEPGLYWLAIVSNAAPTIRCFAVGSLIPVLGYGSALPTAASFGYSVSYTYAALPATYPAGGALITAAPIPSIFVRLSGS